MDQTALSKDMPLLQEDEFFKNLDGDDFFKNLDSLEQDFLLEGEIPDFEDGEEEFQSEDEETIAE